MLVLLITLAPLLPRAFSPTPSVAQSVRAYVPADTVAVGGRFRLWVTAEYPVGARPLFPDTAAFGDLVVLRRSRARGHTVAPGLRRDSVAYEVTTFALDTAHVPPLDVAFAGESDTLRAVSRPFWVPVRSVVPPDAQELKDLAPPAPFPSAGWSYLLLGAAVGLLLALLGYLIWRKRRRAAPEAPAVRSPAASPYEAARARLRALEPPMDPGDAAAIKAFYTALSDTLRRYLAHRLGVAAHECTTRELLAALRSDIRLPAPAVACVHDALVRADLVKFADARPVPPAYRDAREATRAALEAVEETQRTAQPSPSTDDHPLNLGTQKHAEDRG